MFSNKCIGFKKDYIDNVAVERKIADILVLVSDELMTDEYHLEESQVSNDYVDVTVRVYVHVNDT